MRFRIGSIFILVAFIAICFGWYVDRIRLTAELASQRHPIADYWEKHSYWSPSLHLGTDTDSLESHLSEHIVEFSGGIVESSQGVGRSKLRQASSETFDSVVQLIDSNSEPTKLAAVQLLSLYLQSVSGHCNTDQVSIGKRAYYHVAIRDDIEALLQDTNPDIRAAAALVAGNLYFTRKIERTMIKAFDRESEQTVKLYLSWAHHHIAE